MRAEQIQEASDRLRTTDRRHGDALGVEVPTTALGERFERDPVADPFDEHDRTRVDAFGAFDTGRAKPLFLVHVPYSTAVAAPARMPI